ncbi:hypothetical protein BC827DRAFT_904186 [Russula dissimulans]|nr:hypothetical protein BC827DRAFT_904186 [Russula dissimulans]
MFAQGLSQCLKHSSIKSTCFGSSSPSLLLRNGCANHSERPQQAVIRKNLPRCRAHSFNLYHERFQENIRISASAWTLSADSTPITTFLTAKYVINMDRETPDIAFPGFRNFRDNLGRHGRPTHLCGMPRTSALISKVALTLCKISRVSLRTADCARCRIHRGHGSA